MEFATAAIALYAAHHVGDYWVQLDEDAQHKGDASFRGQFHCFRHVVTYVLTQWVFLVITMLVVPGPVSWSVLPALLISGVTHWMADRREHGLMFWLARRLPGKAKFLELGKPRKPAVVEYGNGRTVQIEYDDNPSLGTGAWALDQAWHIFWGVFVAALVIAA